MALHSFTIKSMIDAEVFTDFSYFHNFILGNKKLSFIVSSFILVILAFINLFTDEFILFLICIGLSICVPLFYYLFYRRSLHNQIKVNQLETPKEAYTLTINEKGVHATSNSEQALYPWKNIFRIYCTSRYIYIYIIQNKAFILPLKDLKDGNSHVLWEFITTHTKKTRYFPKI